MSAAAVAPTISPVMILSLWPEGPAWAWVVEKLVVRISAKAKLFIVCTPSVLVQNKPGDFKKVIQKQCLVIE